MNVLVLGSGAREHALGWALSKGGGGCRLWFGPGNAGTHDLGTNLVALDPLDPEAVAVAAREHEIGLVVVGPEEPLGRGVADRLRAGGVPVFGPSRQAALLETSKAYSKDFMCRHGVPTAAAATFRDFDAFSRHMERATGPMVIKKSGLAAGKGVLVAPDTADAIEFGRSVLPQDEILVEELLEGYELSVFVVLDGVSQVLLPVCADHKKAQDGDRGPNTGGMGAVCPVPVVDEVLGLRIQREVVDPTVRGIRAEGLVYRGVLFLGLMVTPGGLRVLEYNVRFGDPEAQVLLPALDIDWLDLLLGAAMGSLRAPRSTEPSHACLGVVVASPGYPDSYPKDLPVTLQTPAEDVLVFHASTVRGTDGATRTGGGRCFTVVGSGPDLERARDKAYTAVDLVRFPGAWYRRDIGARHIRR